MLRKAIASEIETRSFLQQLAARASTPETRKRLLSLADDEIVHRARLERRYREIVGHMPPEPDPPTIELPPDVVEVDLSRALKLALERERDSESYYRFMAERVPATTDLGKLFVELAEMEWRHKTDLQAEYDSTIMADPEEFLLDISPLKTVRRLTPRAPTAFPFLSLIQHAAGSRRRSACMFSNIGSDHQRPVPPAVKNGEALWRQHGKT